VTDKPIIKYGGYLLSEGDKFDIIAAVTESGKCPFMEYFNGLVDEFNKAVEKGSKIRRDLKKNLTTLKGYFDKFTAEGPWNNPSQLKLLEDGFFEFKVDTGLRVPFYYDSRNRSVIIITHYFEKKSQKTPAKELNRMKDIKARFERLRSQGGGFNG
jgi:phage-related protein